MSGQFWRILRQFRGGFEILQPLLDRSLLVLALALLHDSERLDHARLLLVEPLLIGSLQRGKSIEILMVLQTRPGILRALEDAGKRVVILRRNRIELVIVAAGAAGGKSKYGFAEVLDRVVDRQIELALGLTEPARVGDVARRGQFLGAIFVILVRQQIARDLFAQELIERLVLLNETGSRSCDTGTSPARGNPTHLRLCPHTAPRPASDVPSARHSGAKRAACPLPSPAPWARYLRRMHPSPPASEAYRSDHT